MRKIVSEKDIIGLSDLKIEEGEIYGECVIGKDNKISHKKFQHFTITRVLKLFHMDLMGLKQIESLEGIRCVFVCVDDFSRYKWVEFIREKYYTFITFECLCQHLHHEKGKEFGKNFRICGDHGIKFENSVF